MFARKIRLAPRNDVSMGWLFFIAREREGADAAAFLQKRELSWWAAGLPLALFGVLARYL